MNNSKRTFGIRMGKKFSVMLAVAMMLTMMFSITAFADELTDYIIQNTKWDSNNNPTLPSAVASDLSTVNTGNWNGVVTITSPDGTVSRTYYYDDTKTANLTNRVQQQTANANVTQEVTDITQNLNISADVTGATTALSGFIPFISLVLGIIVFFITVGMTIFSAFDLMYIAFPVFRNKCEDAKASGNRAMTKQGSGGDSQLRWVSQDAQFAVESTTNGDSGKNPFMVYFGKRIVSYMALAVLLFILLTGNISIFTNIAVNLMSGIVEILGKLSFN